MFQCLLSFFRGVLIQDASVTNRINTYQGDVYIDKDGLIFSLKALHEFLNQTCEEKIDYANFQRQLYQSTLNQDLKAHGGQVVVHRSTGKVETNLYRLERCSPADPIL